MIIIDVTQTCSTRANTGVQRVVRSVYRVMKETCDVLPVRWDEARGRWVHVEGRWLKNLELGDDAQPSSKRGSSRLFGKLGAAFSRSREISEVELSAADGILLPEPFSRDVYRNLPALRARVSGPCVAIFHDAIPLKLPRFSPPKTLGAFPVYVHQLRELDAVLANSRTSAKDLVGFWSWADADRAMPDVGVITLGVDLPRVAPETRDGMPSREDGVPEILCVGTLEGRKNHLELLSAVEMLWREDKVFRLRMIGMAQRETGREVVKRIEELRAKGRPLQWDGPVSDEMLARAYMRCRFTVYPSLMEGFGIPVIESLAFGKPCICSGKGALGELVARFGGVGIDAVDAGSLSRAIAAMLEKKADVPPVTEPIPTWRDCVRDIGLFLESLRNRPQRPSTGSLPDNAPTR